VPGCSGTIAFPFMVRCFIHHVLLARASFSCYCFVILYFNDHVPTVHLIKQQFYGMLSAVGWKSVWGRVCIFCDAVLEFLRREL